MTPDDASPPEDSVTLEMEVTACRPDRAGVGRGATLAAALLAGALAACAAPAPAKQAWEAPRTPPAPRASDRTPALPPEVESRLTILRVKCARGGVGSCIEIGRLSERGEGGLPRSADRAAEAYGLACQQMDPEGCQRLEALLGADDTTPSDLAPVLATFRGACGMRQEDACAGLATLHAYGLGVPESAAKAAEILAASCTGGGAAACHRLAAMRRLGVLGRPDPEEAARLEREACVLGRQAACVTVGVRVLELTDGRRRSFWYGESGTDRALDAFRTACSKGEHAGCVEYARALADGQGITRDVQAAHDLLRSSCEDGDGRACLALGELALRGPGERAAGAALGWWRRGCQARSGDACTRAGEALLRLDRPAAEAPSRADAEAGRALLERGCALHSPGGCRRLAQLAQRSHAGSPEAARAADFAERACRWGADDGCPTLRAGRALRGL